MAESFIHLPKKEQIEILEALSRKIGRSALHLEKDVWLCWALQNLFSMPNRLPMAFKGGTSLSKAFRAIHRFSEDIDITIDYQAFNYDDPFDNAVHTKLADDGETIFIHYSSSLVQKSPYIENTIRLEFGGRNTTIPNNSYKIMPDIAEHIKELKFPVADVVTLSPQKTFWEKITLIHYECNRASLREDANRISRHWYDIIMLAENDIGKQAINDINQLKDVIKIKKAFYDSSYARYDDCLNGKLCLIPNDQHLNLLEKDFVKMLEEKMFYSDQPKFDNIINKTSKLEKEINAIFI